MAPKSYKEIVCFIVSLVCLTSNALHAVTNNLYDHDINELNVKREAQLHFNDIIVQLHKYGVESAEKIIEGKVLKMVGQKEEVLANLLQIHAKRRSDNGNEIFEHSKEFNWHAWQRRLVLFRHPVVVEMVNIQDEKFGKTLLHYAARNLLSNTVELLIFLGANTHRKNNRGETALHVLVKYVINESKTIKNSVSKRAFIERMRDAKDTLRALLFFKETKLDVNLLTMKNNDDKNINEMIESSEHADFLKKFLTLDELYRCSY